MSTPGRQASLRERELMYIGLGTVVLIVIIIAVVWMLRR